MLSPCLLPYPLSLSEPRQQHLLDELERMQLLVEELEARIVRAERECADDVSELRLHVRRLQQHAEHWNYRAVEAEVRLEGRQRELNGEQGSVFDRLGGAFR